MPKLTDARLLFIQALAAEQDARAAQYRAYRAYYDGDQDAKPNARQRAYLHLAHDESFSVNLCATVVDALAERLSVSGFETKPQELGVQLWQWWIDNKMDGVQGLVHTAAVRDGDTYVLVEWDNVHQRPRITHELAFDGTQGVKLHYDRERRGVVAFASKRWRVESEDPTSAGYVRRMNLYYPDRIEKYISDERVSEATWQPYREPEQPWPLPWPLGIVPLVHFRNMDIGLDFGRSELSDVIPLQNALNKATLDLLAAADMAGFPVYYLLGDDWGDLSLSIGSVLKSQRVDAKVGKIAGSDLTQLLAVCDHLAHRIAQVTRTPLSYFQASGQVAAEGTLKQQESGLLSKARARQVSFGNSWENVMHLCLGLNNLYGQALPEAEYLESSWAALETRNARDLLETLRIKREVLHVPLATLWSEAGYDEQQIAVMQDSPEYQRYLAQADMAQLLRGLDDG